MHKIVSLQQDADGVILEWDDGRSIPLPAIWLRDHCQGAASRDPVSGQRLLNITQIPIDIRIAGAELRDGRLLVDFAPDGHHSEFEAEWLSQHCRDLDRQHDDRSERAKQLWRGDSFADGLPRCVYAAFRDGGEHQLEALRAVRDYGFVVLDAVPCEPGEVLRVIQNFGYVRETNYGPLFEVRARIDANNLAYTNLGLGCHLDNPYRDPVPGLQLLHCLASSTDGGESVLQDGFLAASILRDENREHFEILSRQWINFRFRDAETDLRARVPFIEVDDRDDIIKVRFNNRSIDVIQLPPAQLARFYPAYRHWAEILEREALQVEFKLEAGQLMLFDNTRVLHARRAYSAAGTRHLQGAYSDLDGLYSRLNRLESTA